MPIAVQTGGTTATEPPGSTFWKAALHFNNVSKQARGAAVIVTVNGAEAEAVLVNAFVGTADGVTLKTLVRMEMKIQKVPLNVSEDESAFHTIHVLIIERRKYTIGTYVIEGKLCQ